MDLLFVCCFVLVYTYDEYCDMAATKYYCMMCMFQIEGGELARGGGHAQEVSENTGG